MRPVGRKRQGQGGNAQRTPRDRAEAPRVDGVVEMFTDERVNGWISVPTGTPPVRVSLFLNKLEVAATWATTDDTKRTSRGEARGFNFRLRDIWDYCGTRDRLTVRVGGRPLPIAKYGMFRRPERNGSSSIEDLQARFGEGLMFGQSGRLQLSKQLDTQWQSGVIGLYDEVRRVVKEVHDHDVFLIYGTLLGAVREGTVIGHDLDFDSAFVSKHSEGRAAAEELKEIAFTLIERGYEVEAKPSALHIYHPRDPGTRIDLFHLYFDGAGHLQFPFGIAGTSELPASDWQGTTEIDFIGGRALVPVNGEQMCEHIYGHGWREPKPGFRWRYDRTRADRAARLPDDWCEEVYWASFYAHHEYPSASTFFEAVSARPELPDVVVDIGCGDGRDAFAFATTGRRVTGIDRSHVAVRHGCERAARLGCADRVDFRTCDVSDAAALRALLSEVIERSAGSSVLFYLRFFLHSIPLEVQNTLLGVIDECARPGDMLAAEFRTDKDAAKWKVHEKHYRRFQNGPEFGAQLQERYGFQLLEEREGTGLAPYKDEDPELYRVVARRS